MSSEVYSIAMAAGASSRMPPELRPKACCQVGTISVIEYALQTYEQAGIHKHAVVIGRGGEKVMDTLSGKGYHVLFAYQTQPKGTGDAVRCAVEMLAGIDSPEYVLIAAGDKVIAPEVIRGLMERFAASGNDLCLVAGRSSDYPGAGRIVLREGRAQAIIEVPDIKVRQLAARLKSSPASATTTAGQLAALAEQYVSAKKLGTVFPALKRLTAGSPEKKVPWETVAAAAEEIPDAFDLPCGPVPVQEAFEATWSNLSVYAGRFAAIRSAVEQLRADNVQREWYLTDIVKILASKGGAVGLFRVQNPEDCMAFNTVQELEEVRKVYALRSISAEKYPSVKTWANCFAARSEKGLLAQAVEGLGRRIGSAKTCILVRSPGLINLMGRHIDHQGGLCNMMAIDRDIVLAAALRDDDRVNLWNASERDYPHRTFTFSELATDIVWEDWRRTLNTQFMQRYVSKATGDWVNYVKGAALRLQHRFRGRKLRGMDAFVCGNIPAAGGLSSSSALVVATADALVELNALNVGVQEFVDLCGEGEWFAGRRGSNVDHAAIKFSRANEVLTVSFFPFEIVAHHPFPPDCALIVCDSGASSISAEDARARFNSRVACFHMAREIIKKKFPAFAPRIEHLRDINTRRLDIALPALYALVKELPQRLQPAEVEEMAREYPAVAMCVSALDVRAHDFPVRGVALYGLAECERAMKAGELLQSNEAAALGGMMNLSHDGERVAQWKPKQAPFECEATDAVLDRLAEDAASLRPLAEYGAALWQQPGSYACSTPEVDRMADIARECPGTLGAQIAGVGLGGCVMILVQRESAAEAQDLLRKKYYDPQGIEPRMFVCRPTHGSQTFTTIEAER
ncbi:MAG: NTP transferase domain-containing protein [Candidatus Brocadiia bacterium]